MIVHVKTWYLKVQEATLRLTQFNKLEMLNALMKIQSLLKEKRMVTNLMFGTTNLKKKKKDNINLKKE